MKIVRSDEDGTSSRRILPEDAQMALPKRCGQQQNTKAYMLEKDISYHTVKISDLSNLGTSTHTHTHTSNLAVQAITSSHHYPNNKYLKSL